MDKPLDQFRGWFIPAPVVELYESGKLSEAELILLSKIDALQDKKRGGCWASNQYLAQWWGKRTVTWVSKTVSKFQAMGLVKVTQLPDQSRIVRTTLPLNYTSRPLEENFKLPLNYTSTKPPLRERGDTRGVDRPVADVLLPGLGADSTQLSQAVTEFANWSRRHGYHVRVPGPTPTYSKGGGPGGWSRATLIRWEEAYAALCSRHGNGKVNRTLKRFLRWYESEYAPVVHTLTSFAEKFERIHKFVEKEKTIREKNGEDPDDLDHPEVQLRTVNKGTVKQIAEVE